MEIIAQKKGSPHHQRHKKPNKNKTKKPQNQAKNKQTKIEKKCESHQNF